MLAKRRGIRFAVVATSAVVAVVAVIVLSLNGSRLIAKYEFRQQFQALGTNAQGFDEYRHRQTRIVFVHVPGGAFQMGSRDGEPGSKEDEHPRHEVTLSSFLVAKHEISQRQWEAVMGDKSWTFAGDDFPAEGVTFEDCTEFCDRTGLSIPTEARWEFACRARSDDDLSDAKTLSEVAWFNRNAGATPRPVGRKSPNSFGLHDTHGNVWEWCADVYSAEFYSQQEASAKDPVSVSGSDFRVLRGGSWGNRAQFCRSASRHKWNESKPSAYVGFRPAGPAPP